MLNTTVTLVLLPLVVGSSMFNDTLCDALGIHVAVIANIFCSIDLVIIGAVDLFLHLENSWRQLFAFPVDQVWWNNQKCDVVLKPASVAASAQPQYLISCGTASGSDSQ